MRWKCSALIGRARACVGFSALFFRVAKSQKRVEKNEKIKRKRNFNEKKFSAKINGSDTSTDAIGTGLWRTTEQCKY